MYAPPQWFDLTLIGNAFGQVIINHFYYGVADFGLPIGGDLADVALDFQTIVLPSIVAVCSVGVTFTQIDIQEHVSSLRFHSQAVTSGNVGLRTGEMLPTFNAWGYKSIRGSAEVKSAHKRFGPIAEGDVQNGVAVTGFLTTLGALAAALGRDFSVGNGGTTDLDPLAITRVDTTVDPHVPRPIPLFEPATDWIYQKVTSQVSRRI